MPWPCGGGQPLLRPGGRVGPRDCRGLEPLRAQGIAPVVLVEADQAKVLGQAMAQRVEGPLLCLDSVGVDNGDYIDIGAPVAGGAVLPVVIKTLVFNKS
ncbi:MAG: ethanolamine ammonia-lyase reactivating factor EutA [Flavonifractor plautii]